MIMNITYHACKDEEREEEEEEKGTVALQVQTSDFPRAVLTCVQ